MNVQVIQPVQKFWRKNKKGLIGSGGGGKNFKKNKKGFYLGRVCEILEKRQVEKETIGTGVSKAIHLRKVWAVLQGQIRSASQDI